MRYGSIGGPEYEVPQSRLYCPCINVALCPTALQCICRVIRRSSVTMKAHTYYVIFGRPPIAGKLPPSPWRRHCQRSTVETVTLCCVISHAVRRLVREEPALQLLIGRITGSSCSSSGAWMHYAARGGRANALQMRYGFRCFGVRSLAYLDPSSGRVVGRQRPPSCRRRTSPNVRRFSFYRPR